MDICEYDNNINYSSQLVLKCVLHASFHKRCKRDPRRWNQNHLMSSMCYIYIDNSSFQGIFNTLSDWFLPVFISHDIDTVRGSLGMFSPRTPGWNWIDPLECMDLFLN